MRCWRALFAAAVLAPLGAGAARVDLAELDAAGSELLRVLGSSGEGRFGVPVAGGRDVDGDGGADLALAAMRASPLGREFAGEVLLVFGANTLAGSIDTAIASAAVLRIAGAGPREATGNEIWIDDVTGDGVADLLIGRQNHTPEPARPGAGALTVVVGAAALAERAAALLPLDLAAPPPEVAATTFIGSHSLNRLGIWVRTGDVTGDGIADLVLGADQTSGGGETHRGSAYVVRGGAHLATAGVVDLASFGATALAGHIARIDPPIGSNEFHFGATCAIADLDENGRGEVLVAAALNRAGGSLSAAGQPGVAHSQGGAPNGRLYIAWDDNFIGNPWPAGFAFTVTDPPGTGTELRGGSRNRHFGEEVLGGEDWDGDGSADLFVGDIDGDLSPGQDRPASGAGHVFYDAATLAGRVLDLDTLPAEFATTTLVGAASGDIAGDTAAAGDFDADGLADLAVASPHASPLGRASAGALHVLHGQTGPWPPWVDLAAPLPTPPAARVSEILGAAGAASGDRGDTLAYSAAAGWVDGDATVDLIINEMLGNGSGPAAVDVGNLLVVSGALLVPEPGGARAALGVALLLGGLRRRRRTR